MTASSRKALLIIVGGFSIVLLANSVMIYFAINTWTGLETEQHFVKGLAYNDNLEGARRQQARGWDMQLQTNYTTGTSGDIVVDFKDRDGNPMADLSVAIFAVRPTHEGYDRKFVAKSTGDGGYTTPFSLPLPGVWDLRVVAWRGEDDFQRVERVVTP